MKKLRTLGLFSLVIIARTLHAATPLEDLTGLTFGQNRDALSTAVQSRGGVIRPSKKGDDKVRADGMSFLDARPSGILLGFRDEKFANGEFVIMPEPGKSPRQTYDDWMTKIAAKLGPASSTKGEGDKTETIWMTPQGAKPAEATFLRAVIGDSDLAKGKQKVVRIFINSGAYGNPENISTLVASVSSTPAPTPPATVASTSAPTHTSSAAPLATAGLTLTPGWDGRMQGGRDTLEDLEKLLSNHVQPGSDTGAHPEITIYQGVKYLMPVDDAIKALGSPRKMNSRVAVACPGFPLNSFFTYSFDGQFEGHFNRLFLVADRADKVVSVQLVDETPKGTGATEPVPFRTYNFVNARTKASQSYVVKLNVTAKTQVIRAHTSLHGNGKVLEEVVWYLPKPLAGLIRTCIQKTTASL